MLRHNERLVNYCRDLLEPFSKQRPVSEEINKRENEFVHHCWSVLESKYAIVEFDTHQLAGALNISHRQLQRKIKSLFAMTPRELIKSYRLKKSAELLSEGLSVTQACYSCGFTDTSYFSKSFKTQFNIAPSNYANKIKQIGLVSLADK